MLEGALGEALRADGVDTVDWATLCAKSSGRARQLYAGLTEKQKQVVTDPSIYLSLIGTRRSGKTHLMSSMALITGEAKPGSIVLVGSLNLKYLRRNFWFGSPSGITTLARKYDLKLKYNSTELRWEHENGSIGYLLGAETKDMLEYWRGIEADLYLLDECKSFAPSILDELLDDIISPQRMTRDGRVLLAGTPGSILSGPFYEQTNPGIRKTVISEDEDGHKVAVPGPSSCVPFGEVDPYNRRPGLYTSFHRLTLLDNTAKPHQVQAAQDHKERKGWADDHPTWLREYCGQWIATADGLVYGYVGALSAGVQVNWEPNRTVDNPTGLPQELGPWHLVYGLDLGFENPTALVVAAWSERVREVRHVYDVQCAHLHPEGVLSLIVETMAQYGIPEMVVADAGNLAKMVVSWLESKGIPIVKAEKTEKFDHVELINAEFATGRIKIIAKTDLESQLTSVQWDLSDGAKKDLSRRGKLREDPSCINDLTDALLYLLRYCYHGFATPLEKPVEKNTPEWWVEQQRASYQAAAKSEREKMTQSSALTPARLPWGRNAIAQPKWRFS